MIARLRLSLVAMFMLVGTSPLTAQDEQPIRILFLGDNGHHRPADRFRQLQPILAARGIDVTYTDDVTSLRSEALQQYDGLLIYANIERIAPEQEQALLDFVDGGKGLIPLHCASYCFHNSPAYIDLVGAQFQRHGTGIVRTVSAAPDHPIMRGFEGFESWDETYVHTRHNEQDRTVLEYRVDREGREPWTWVRTHGQGRVFYTAWGHDHRTWGEPGFQNLVERGIRWAIGRDPSQVPDYRERAEFPVPEMAPRPDDLPELEYIDVGNKIPNYTRSRQWGTQGEPLSQMQVPLAPQQSIKRLVVPRGFHPELYAAEPDLQGKPICMAWDERGRLWVAETIDYPNELQPPGQGRDRIRICEDSDGDGTADTFTVFAENLSIPTSIIFHRGGAIVQNGMQTVYLKDTDGDDRADVRQTIFSGWGVQDTHGGVSNFQYGLDNWIWAMQGYNMSRIEAGGERHQFRQGFFRFKPDGSKLEFVRSTNNNTWGLGISEEGIVFGSTANRNPSEYMPIPNRYYEQVRGWATSLVLNGIADSHLFRAITEHVRQVDQHGGYTAAAGHALYTAREYPQEYWNRVAFVTEPTGHLVGSFILQRDGSNFQSTNPFNLVASDDEWTAPIMAAVGPDGHVWVIDWYNYIVQHNPTPHGFRTGRGAAYETDLRDKKHGRIYRIVYGDGAAALDRSMSLADATPGQLVETLTHTNQLWRSHAQRLLVERGETDVAGALIDLVRDQQVDQIGLNVGAIHALWTLHGLGLLDGSHEQATAAVVAALRHPSAGVRRNAVQVLPSDPQSVAALLEAKLLEDADFQVRLAALLALADLPSTPAAGQAIAQVLANPANTSDRWLPDAAIVAAANNAPRFLAAVSGHPEASPELVDAIAIVAEHFARSEPGDAVAALIAQLADAHPEIITAVLSGLENGWPEDEPPGLSDELEGDLEQLLSRLDPDQRAVVVRLALVWGSQRFQQYLEALTAPLAQRVGDESLEARQRIAAARQLVRYQPTSQQAATIVLEAVNLQTPPDLATQLLETLDESEADELGTKIVEQMAALTPSVRRAAVGILLSRAEWTGALLDAADAGKIQLAELSLDQQQSLMRHPSQRVRRRAQAWLRSGGALPNPDRQKVVDMLLAVTTRPGDVAAGKEVFKAKCAKCHVHGGEGTRVGPDLTGMAAHPKQELLVHILDPSRSVEANYRVYTLVTTEGSVLNGLLAAESRTSVELVDAEGKRHTLLREDIEELLASPKSLMPDGFEKEANEKELADLLAFLTERGQYLPLPLDRVATAVSSRGMFTNPNAGVERLVFDDWAPKTFQDVPFHLVDPQEERFRNVILLHGPQGSLPPTMPKSVRIPSHVAVRRVHMLSGVSGWGFPYGERGSLSLIVRLHYEDGSREDHLLRNGIHFADYIRRVDVPESQFAFDLGGRQIRYLAITPERSEPIRDIEFLKGEDDTAPVIMAVTLETHAPAAEGE